MRIQKFFQINQQDSRAIQYMSEVVNETVLKYMKTVIIFLPGRALPLQAPLAGAPPQTPCFYFIIILSARQGRFVCFIGFALLR